jgi:hypothetical protein
MFSIGWENYDLWLQPWVFKPLIHLDKSCDLIISCEYERTIVVPLPFQPKLNYYFCFTKILKNYLIFVRTF